MRNDLVCLPKNISSLLKTSRLFFSVYKPRLKSHSHNPEVNASICDCGGHRDSSGGLYRPLWVRLGIGKAPESGDSSCPDMFLRKPSAECPPDSVAHGTADVPWRGQRPGPWKATTTSWKSYACCGGVAMYSYLLLITYYSARH